METVNLKSLLVLRFGDEEKNEIGTITLVSPKENLTWDAIKAVADIAIAKHMFYDADGVAFASFLGAYYENTVDTEIAAA